MAELVCRPQDHEQWITARRQGVTATDIVTLAGLASWDSPFALYWRKKGVLPEVAQSPRMRLGLWLEDKVIEDWYMRQEDAVWESGLYRSSERPWQLATPDRLIKRDRDSWHAVLEVKTAISRDGWGDDGTDEVPARVRAQVLWQMDVLGVAVGYVAVCFLPSGEIRSYTITPDEEWRDALRHLGATFFWQLEHDAPPPVDGLPATTEALKHLHAMEPKTDFRMPDGFALDLQWDYWHDREHEAKEAKAAIVNSLRDQMHAANYVVDNHGERLFRREVYKRREYTVPAGVVDRLVRVKPKETGDASSQ